jgi:5-formyltetrahydrofolate cyclo-ligase
VRLIKGGDYRVVISVTDRGGRQVYTSPTIQFHVRQKPVLQAGRVLPVAAGIPLLFIGLMVFNRTKHRLGRVQG